VASGATLTTELVNGMINRTEYAADLLRQYKLTAGTDMYVEPHYDGTRVSYLQPVAGGATPTQSTGIVGDRVMVVGTQYYFASGEAVTYKLIIPTDINRSLYKIFISGGYWAFYTSTGSYNSYFAPFAGTTIYIGGTGGPNYPSVVSFGCFPNPNGDPNIWQGGGITLLLR
jgi:hypothetical protein